MCLLMHPHCARQAAGLQGAPTLLLLPAQLPWCSAAGLRASRCALCSHGSGYHQSQVCNDESVCRALRCVAKKNGRMISSSTKQPQQRAEGRQASVFQQSARGDKLVRAAAWPQGAVHLPSLSLNSFENDKSRDGLLDAIKWTLQLTIPMRHVCAAQRPLYSTVTANLDHLRSMAAEDSAHAAGASESGGSIAVSATAGQLGDMQLEGDSSSSSSSATTTRSRIHCFTEQAPDATLHLQIIDLGLQLYIWVAVGGAKLQNMYLAIQSKQVLHLVCAHLQLLHACTRMTDAPDGCCVAEPCAVSSHAPA